MKVLTERTSEVFIWIGIGILILGFVLFINGENLFNWDEEIKSDKVGQLGDFIGGVAGAIWALAGVILFYVALDKQKEALELQIQEFQLQRIDLSETRAVFKEQSETQKLMQYETTFYNLIDLLQKVVNDINIQRSSTVQTKSGYTENWMDPNTRIDHPPEYQAVTTSMKGRECIEKIYNDIRKEIESENNKNGLFLEVILKNNYEKHEIYLRPYFNILIQILIKIHRCPLENHDHYVDIFSAMLTENEMDLITIYRDEEYVDDRLDELLTKYLE